MASEVFNIFGELGLNIKGFETKMEKAKKNLNSFSARSKKMKKQLKASFSAVTSAASKLGDMLGVGGVLSGAGLVALSVRAQNAAKEIDMLATTTGSSVREVQSLTLGFKDLGLEADDVGDVLNTLADRSQDAKDGMQSFIDDFKLVGVEVEDLKGKRPAELFDVFADAVSKTEDPIKRQSAIVRILGDDLGRKLSPALMNGSKHFKDIGDQAEKAGLLMDEKAVRGGLMAAKAMSRLKSVVDAGLNKAFIQLAPLVGDITNRLTNLITNQKEFESVVKSGVNNIIGAVGFLLDAVNGLSIAWKGVKVVALGFTTALTSAIDGLFQILAKFGDMVVQAVLLPLKGILTAASKLPKVGKQAAEALNAINNVKIERPQATLDLFNSQMEALIIAKGELDAKLAEAPPSEGLKQWAEGVTSTIEKLSEVKTNVEEINRAIDRQTDSLTMAASVNTEYNKQWEENFKKQEEEVNKLGTALREQLGSGLKSALEGDFSSITKSFGNMLQNMIVEAMAADIANAIGLPGTSNSGGSGLLSTAFRAIGGMFGFPSFDGGGSTGSAPRSGGLDGKGGFLAMVHPNETVVDHTKGQSMTNINLNVTMSGSESSAEIRKSAAQMARELKRELSQV